MTSLAPCVVSKMYELGLTYACQVDCTLFTVDQRKVYQLPLVLLVMLPSVRLSITKQGPWVGVGVKVQVPAGAQGFASHTMLGKFLVPTKAQMSPRVSSKYFKVGPSQVESTRACNALAAEVTNACPLVPKTVAPAMAPTKAGPI